MSAESLTILMAVASGVFAIVTSIIGWIVSRMVAQLDRLRERTEQLEQRNAASQASLSALPTLDSFKELLVGQLEPINGQVGAIAKQVGEIASQVVDVDRRVIRLEERSKHGDG
jgi:hypothetical protein